ncbi:hypothetical protein HYG89_06265 [Acinetobacter sp. SwsAc5]|uniref:hypothetical protein n=1 Tax=Acinetobacter sp. SwsAc5 TaxID=2749438 RepID=UPI0015C052BA|nr:hypothetical protein [Acinetobacter sp. SwsAc5]NWK52164.1 hypothetical protein [Acinetobacter sp. SwsAc5]
MNKWFSFSNFGAPQFTNSFGALINVLDACLVDGYGNQDVTSIEVADGMAIAKFENSHLLKQFQVVEISGAADSSLNGEYRILGLTADTIEFSVNAADQIATGSISCKVASLGWTKVFSGDQKAVYRAKDIAANPYYLRVDNSRDPVYNENYAKFAKVGILEGCSHIDDFSANQVPYDVSNQNKNWVGTGSGTSAVNGWAKWYHAISEYGGSSQINETSAPSSTENGEWTIVGSDDSFYLMSMPIRNGAIESNKITATYTYGFGVTEKKGFRVPFLLAHLRNVAVNSSEFFFNSNPLRYGWAQSTVTMTTNNGAYSQDLAAWPQYYLPTRNTSITTMLSGTGAGVFANPEPGIYFSKVMLHSNSNAYLGAFPILYSMQTSYLNHPDNHTFTEDGECYLIKRVAQANSVGAFIFSLGEL